MVIFKEKLAWFKRIIVFKTLVFFNKLPNVKGIEDTIKTILKNNASLIRFGDGELYIMKGGHLGFQQKNQELANRLWQIFKENSTPKRLICIQGIINGFSKLFKPEVINHWKKHLYVYGPIYSKYRKDLNNYDTCSTRLYSQYLDKKFAIPYFNLWKDVWKNREILIIEGKQTRFGINNNLLDTATCIKRILCPAENAFDKYDLIKESAIKYGQNKLILIALGPTATILSYDLSDFGYQAIDIGHLDIEYEWFLAQADYKTKVKNKYVNENTGLTDTEIYFNDPSYSKQIICDINIL